MLILPIVHRHALSTILSSDVRDVYINWGGSKMQITLDVFDQWQKIIVKPTAVEKGLERVVEDEEGLWSIISKLKCTLAESIMLASIRSVD